MKKYGQITKQAQHGALYNTAHKFPFETQYYHETSHPQPEKKISPHVSQVVRNNITFTTVCLATHQHPYNAQIPALKFQYI